MSSKSKRRAGAETYANVMIVKFMTWRTVLCSVLLEVYFEEICASSSGRWVLRDAIISVQIVLHQLCGATNIERKLQEGGRVRCKTLKMQHWWMCTCKLEIALGRALSVARSSLLLLHCTYASTWVAVSCTVSYRQHAFKAWKRGKGGSAGPTR